MMLTMLLASLAAPVPQVDCKVAAPAFMASYATDLLAGDRPALVARYAARGAYFLGFEAKSFDAPATIAQHYAGAAWQKPDAFSWQALSVEQLGPAACLVTGGFRWTARGRTMDFAYTAVLRGEAGGLKIQLEHENPLTPAK
jgi:hypothetical protein